jgi:hypothetical protein
MKFIVITEVPPEGHRGNLALNTEVYVDEQNDPSAPLRRVGVAMSAPALVMLRSPVFTLGEVLICGHDERELVGSGRKPTKWGVKTEVFDNVEAAVERAREVML